MTQKKLLHQVQAWRQQENYRKIWQALAGYPEDSLTPELIWSLAVACLQISSQSDRREQLQMAGRALDLLQKMPEDAQRDVPWMMTCGSALLQLDRGDEALVWLEKARDLEPDNEEIRTVLQNARSLTDSGGGDACYRARTVQVWQRFLEVESLLRPAVDPASPPPQSTLNEFHTLLNDTLEPVITPPQTCSLMVVGERARLELRLTYTPFRLFPMQYFIRHAPASLREHWDFVPGIMPLREFTLEEPLRLDSRNIQVRITSAHGKSAALDVFSKPLVSMIRREGRDDDTLCRILLSLFLYTLGEIATLRLELSGRAVESRTEEFFPLDQLPARLTEAGLPVSNDPEAYLADLSENYDPSCPGRIPLTGLRSDITLGNTSLPDLLEAFCRHNTEIADVWLETGILTGFFWFSRSGLDSSGGDTQAWKILDNLQVHLEQAAGADALQVIGWAMGTRNVYLDVIAWDSQTMLREAALFFQDHPVKKAAFQSFNINHEALWLTDVDN